ncbi:MAG: TniB protein [Firmicutes bacterium]|nr:TniB protein [Bacillota bacterium]
MNEKWKEASTEGKYQHLKSLHCYYPRLKVLIGKLESCHNQPKWKKDPECLFIKGIAGVGKSTLIRIYASRHPRRQTEEGMIIPVLTASAPVPATIRGLASRILKEMGDPAYDIGTTNKLSARLHYLIKECGVELIVLDEFQHFLDSESYKPSLNAANWIKELINETGIPVVLIGMPSSECIFYSRDQHQLSRRFKSRTSLDPFSWDNPSTIKEFRSFLKMLNDELPLPESSYLHSTDTAFRIFYSTDGILDHIMTLVKSACGLAIERSLLQINHDLLAESFSEHIKPVLGWKKNPFRDSVANLKEIDVDYQPVLPPNAPKSASKEKNKKNNNVKTLLSAQ